MKKIYRFANCLAMFAMMISLFCADVDAGSRSSSSRSSSSSFRSSSVSKPSTSSWSNRSSSSSNKPATTTTLSKPATPAVKPSTSTQPSVKPQAQPSQVAPTVKPQPVSTSPPKTAAQQAVFTKAKENGTLYTNKTQAVNDFKSKHASTYTSTYKSEPPTRPTHIPQTTTINNKNYNVVYNQSHGGYGYWSGGGPGLGTWMMYDMMSDAVMMSAMMNRHNYVVHSQPVESVTNTTTTHSDGSVTQTTTSTGPSFGSQIIGCLLFILLVIFIIVVIHLGAKS